MGLRQVIMVGRQIQTKITNISLAAVLGVSGLAGSAPLFLSQKAYASHTGTFILVNGADVTDDTGGCGDTANPCNNIQAGVNHAVSGDTVHIEAGLYDEQIIIDGKNITLEGVGDTTLIKPSSPLTLVDSYTYPVGVLSGWAGLKLASPIIVKNSSNVTVQYLKVDGINASSLPAGSDRLSGIVYGEAGGLISHVTINNIKTTGYSVRTYAIDVSSVSAPLNVEIAHSAIDDFSRTGIQAQGANLTANIHDNTVTGPGTIGPANVPNGIVLIAGATGQITNNIISENHYTGSSFLGSGILLYQAGSGITVSSNAIFDVDDAILIAGTSGATISNNHQIHNNVKGIQIEQAGATNNLITNNTLTDNTYGIFLAASAGANNSASENNITSSTTLGVNNESSNPFSAENNYWGSAVPATVASEFSGTVTYAPYYVEPTRTYLNTDLPSVVYVKSAFSDGNTVGTNAMAYGWDAFNTITEGISAVAPTGTVNLAAETFAEQISITKSLTLQGAGDNALTGTVIGTTGGGSLVTVAANGITLRDLRIDRQGTGNGLSISGSTVSSLTLDGITVTGAVGTLISPGTGLRVGTGTTITGLTVTDSHFDGNDIGWYLAKESANSSTITGVSVTNTTFSNNSMKGLYAEKLENTVFDNVTVANSGTNSGYGFNAGIDINLKWSAYSNIEISNSTVTGSGLQGSATAGSLFPVGITIKARDDAPSYASPAASLNNVTIDNVTVSGGVHGLRFGEPGKNNAGPTSVTVSNSRLSGNSGQALINETQATVVANGNWWGNNLGPSTTQPDITAASWCADSTCTPPFLSASGSTTTLPVDEPVDLSGLVVVSGGSASAEIPGTNEVVISTTVGTQTIEATIQPGTTVTSSSISWDGTIDPPTVQPAASVSIPTPSGSTTTVATVIEVGSSSETLVFDTPVRLLIPGQAGQRVGFVRAGETTFNEITNPCLTDSLSAAIAAIVGSGECQVDVGTDKVVWTKHFTKFVTFSQSSTSTPAAGGGSGSSSPVSSKSTQPGSTFRPTFFAAAGDSEVLSSSTEPKTSSATTEVKPPLTPATAKAEASSDKILGLMWYWWLIVVAAAAVAFYGIARLADTNKTK